MVRPIFKSSSTETRIAESGSWLSNPGGGGGGGGIAPVEDTVLISGTQEI